MNTQLYSKLYETFVCQTDWKQIIIWPQKSSNIGQKSYGLLFTCTASSSFSCLQKKNSYRFGPTWGWVNHYIIFIFSELCMFLQFANSSYQIPVATQKQGLISILDRDHDQPLHRSDRQTPTFRLSTFLTTDTSSVSEVQVFSFCLLGTDRRELHRTEEVEQEEGTSQISCITSIWQYQKIKTMWNITQPL